MHALKLALLLLLTACAGQSASDADATTGADAAPAPPLFFVALLPGDTTATLLADTPTATDLPLLPIVPGGQGFSMVLPRIAARAPWAGHINLKLWLERDDDGYPLPAGLSFAFVSLDPLGPLWVSPELPLVIDTPCSVVGHVLHARADAAGAGVNQHLDGRFHVSFGQNCP